MSKKYFHRSVYAPRQFLLAGLMLVFMAHSATAATATTLGDLITNLYLGTKPFAQMFQYAAWGMGAVFSITGIHHLRLHIDSPSNNPINRGLMLLFGAMCMLALPSVFGVIITTLGLNPAATGTLTVQPCGTGGGLDVAMCRFVYNIKGPLLNFVSAISIVSGIFMIIHGLSKASKYGFDPRTHSIQSILTKLLFGSLLITIGGNMNMMLSSVFGTGTSLMSVSANSTLSWSAAVTGGLGATAQFMSAVNAGLTFVQLIGAIAFVRGWMVLKKVSEGGGNATLAQGITHVLGGTACINIFFFLSVMDQTFGTGLLN